MPVLTSMGVLAEADMEGDVTYKTTNGDPFTMAHSVILPHFFNHYAYHHCQAHDHLSQTGIEPPVLDFLYCIRD